MCGVMTCMTGPRQMVTRESRGMQFVARTLIKGAVTF